MLTALDTHLYHWAGDEVDVVPVRAATLYQNRQRWMFASGAEHACAAVLRAPTHVSLTRTVALSLRKPRSSLPGSDGEFGAGHISPRLTEGK